MKHIIYLYLIFCALNLKAQSQNSLNYRFLHDKKRHLKEFIGDEYSLLFRNQHLDSAYKISKKILFLAKSREVLFFNEKELKIQLKITDKGPTLFCQKDSLYLEFDSMKYEKRRIYNIKNVSSPYFAVIPGNFDGIKMNVYYNRMNVDSIVAYWDSAKVVVVFSNFFGKYDLKSVGLVSLRERLFISYSKNKISRIHVLNPNEEYNLFFICLKNDQKINWIMIDKSKENNVSDITTLFRYNFRGKLKKGQLGG